MYLTLFQEMTFSVELPTYVKNIVLRYASYVQQYGA